MTGWTMELRDWKPPNLNKSRGRHWHKSHKATKTAGEVYAAEAFKAGVPLVTDTYRPVRSVQIVYHAKGKLPDPDNLLKNTLDALKRARLVVDDSAKWCHWTAPVVGRITGPGVTSLLTLAIEDVPANVVAHVPDSEPQECTAPDVYARLCRVAELSDKAAIGDVLWECAVDLARNPIQAEWGTEHNPSEILLTALHLPEIHTGDCCDYLRTIAGGTAQLVFADPPFNIGYEYDQYNDRRERSEYLRWAAGWLWECARILSPRGSLFVAIGDEFAAEYKLMLTEAGLYFRNWIIWEYHFGAHCPRKFGRNHAHVLYFTADPKRFTFNADAVREPSARQTTYNDKRANPAGRVPGDVWHYPRLPGNANERTGHPCQMPEALMERIIRVASNPGEVVFDPFAGSGTTLAVAKRLGRIPRGAELSAPYAGKVRERLAAVVPDLEPDPEFFG